MSGSDRPIKIGLIVNPIAGMGGSVGLKGTDGDTWKQAVALGARAVAPAIASQFVAALSCSAERQWLAAPGAMGADTLAAAGIGADPVGTIGGPTSADDTRRIAARMADSRADLIVVVGGDGTLRDVAAAVGTRVGIVAVPAGVKIYSAAFAVNARAAARLIDAYATGAPLVEAEVVDIDESAYRDGRLTTRHHAFVLVPEVDGLVQGGKESSSPQGQAARLEAAEAVAEAFLPGELYLLGPGTTLRAVAECAGIDKTLLGVDALLDGAPAGRDLNERAMLSLLDKTGSGTIVVTPLGGNGFLFGRGNRQFTPEVIRRVGTDRVVVVAGRDKLTGLACLRVDTGDAGLDAELGGYREVVVGHGIVRIMRVA